VVVAEDLSEEGTEGDHGCEDPAAGLADLLSDGSGEVVGGEDAVKEETGVEDEGAEEAAKLCGRPAVDRIGHGRPSLCCSKVVGYPRLEARWASPVHPQRTKSFTAVSVPFKYERDVTCRCPIANGKIGLG
jgi:hypothetical protein